MKCDLFHTPHMYAEHTPDYFKSLQLNLSIYISRECVSCVTQRMILLKDIPTWGNRPHQSQF